MSILKLLASDGFLSVNKHLARIVGLDAAVLLAELASAYNYFEMTDRLTDDGMFFETVEHIEENTTLSKYQQAKAVKALTDAGIIETKKIGIPAKRYFLIKEDKILQLLDHKKSKNLTTGSEKTSPQEVEKLDRINKDNNKSSNNKYKFMPPTVEEVAEYCMERNNGIDAEQFVDFYASKGWKVGRDKMTDWKASVRTWERRHKQSREDKRQQKKNDLDDYYRMAYEFTES
jgi:hypothetical protein